MKSLKFYSKSRKRRASPEAELQKCVVQYLKLAGVPGLLYFSVPNEGKRSPRMANYLKNLGMLPGVSDLVIIVPGRVQHGPNCPLVLFLELKAKGQKPTEAQMDFSNVASEAGCNWFWTDNLNAAIDILQVYGAIKKVPRRRSATSPLAEAA